MADPIERLHEFDRNAVPDLWADITSRKARDLRADHELSGKGKVLVICLSLLVAAVGIAGVIYAFRGAIGLSGPASQVSRGRVSVTLVLPQGTSSAEVEATRQVMVSRLDHLGVSGARIAASNGTTPTMSVSVPSNSLSRAELVGLLTSTGTFQMRPVIYTPSNQPKVISPSDPQWKTTLLTCMPPTPSSTTCTAPGSQSAVLEAGDGGAKYFLGPAAISNTDLASAKAVVYPASTTPGPVGWVVQITLTPGGSDAFASLTSQMIGKELANVIDAQVISAPVVQASIMSGSATITGNFTDRSAKDLAAVLNSGPLPVPVTVQTAESPKPTPKVATPPPAVGQIAFTDSNLRIAVMNSNGSGVRQLTTGNENDPYLTKYGGQGYKSQDIAPHWAPGGKEIYFLRRYNMSVYSLCEVSVTGTGFRVLIRNFGSGDFALSPDGTQIAFASNGDSISVMGIDGSSRHTLAPFPGLPYGVSASWSPNGKEIAFASESGLWVLEVSSGKLTEIAKAGGIQGVMWDPTAAWIAYTVPGDQQGGFSSQVWLIHPDGTGARLLTGGTGFWTSDAWSPDGSQLLLGRLDSRLRDNGLAIIGADGTGLRVVNRTSLSAFASWRP